MERLLKNGIKFGIAERNVAIAFLRNEERLPRAIADVVARYVWLTIEPISPDVVDVICNGAYLASRQSGSMSIKVFIVMHEIMNSNYNSSPALYLVISIPNTIDFTLKFSPCELETLILYGHLSTDGDDVSLFENRYFDDKTKAKCREAMQLFLPCIAKKMIS